MSAALQPEDPMEELLQLLYLAPVGMLKFDREGWISLLNPMASQLLLPLLPEPALDNLFTALRVLVPDLRARLAAEGPRLGTLIDNIRLDGCVGGRACTLSLSVARVGPESWMAAVKDVTRLTEMLAFAFTAADLLLDLDEQGRVLWAAGPTAALLGREAAELIGGPAAALVAPRDRQRLRRAIAGVGRAGRLAPIQLHLANARRTPCVVAGLRIAEPTPRFHMTIGRVPDQDPVPATPVTGAPDVLREAQEALREGEAATLGLVEVPRWTEAAQGLDAGRLDSLRDDLSALARRYGGEDGRMGELGQGRFALVGASGADVAALVGAVGAAMEAAAPGAGAGARGTALALDAKGLDVEQALQAVRLAVGRFAGQGLDGVAALGAAGGLPRILDEARGRKQALARIIEARAFDLAFQPIVHLADRKVHHHEALLRPRPGPDNPAAGVQEFVMWVEAMGLARALDAAVFDTACAAARAGGARVAVNISALSLVDPAFVDRLLQGSAASAPGRLMFELTETAEVENLSAIAAQLQRLRAAGIAVCLDDFGAGSAGFRSLKELAVDIVKIDGAYVEAAGRHERGRAFIIAMRDLAVAAGADVVAERIETEEEAALMAGLGITFGQGWLFGRPGPLPAPAAAPAQAAPKEPSKKVERWRY